MTGRATGSSASSTRGSPHRLSTHRWGGTMGFSHDGLPYIGRAGDGIYRCGGFTGHGQGYALAAGELVSALIRTGSHPDAELFDPDRA